MTAPRKIDKLARPYLLAIALSIPVHIAFVMVALPRLQPHYLDHSVDVEQNSINAISNDSAHYYGHHARLLIERGAFETEAGSITSHMPGTALFLAASKLLVGHLGLYGFVQAGLLFVAVLLFCRRAVRVYNPRAVAWAAFLFLTHPALLFLAWIVNSDAFFTSLLLACVAALMQASPSPKRLSGAGSLMGLACYFREIALINALGAAAGLLKRRPFRVGGVVCFLGTFLLVLAPWVVRNALATHSLIVTTSKAPRIFFLTSFGITTQDVNPFDIDEGGSVSLDAAKSMANAFLAQSGYEPSHDPGNSFYVRNGIRNYVSHPLVQLRSLGIKLANFLRPLVARRHIMKLLPKGVATVAFGVLFLQHAALVWVGVFLLFIFNYPGLRALRGMLLGSTVISLMLWAEPRYLVPFYLPLYLLSLHFFVLWFGSLGDRGRTANGRVSVTDPSAHDTAG